jgi:hypothetical protein
VTLSMIKRRFVASVCAFALAGFAATVLADSGSGGDDDDGEEQTYLVWVEFGDLGGPLVQVEMSRIEVEQRCEQDNRFADNNVQTCTQVVGS